jgi:macrolide transport system ATP-binding/permease protein
MRWPFRQRKQREKDLEDEIAFDLAADTEERVRAGLSREEADYASRHDLGNTALIKEDVRETWGWAALGRLGQDIRYGCRTLRKNPLFGVMAVLSLALGIGSATAIYSVMDAVLFRALPVQHPRELVILNWRAIKPPASGFTQPAGIRTVDGSVYNGPVGDRLSPDFPWPFYALLRDGNDVFSSVFAYKDAGQLTVSIRGQAELAGVQFVSGNFFDSLGINPAAGRLIFDTDNLAGAPTVAVLGYNYWRDRFAADITVVGRTIRIGRLPFTICGVAASEFFGLAPGSSPALYIPIGTRPVVVADSVATPAEKISMFTDTSYYWTDMMGRMRPGITMARAEAETGTRFRQFVIAAGANANRADFPSLWLEEGGSGLDSLRRRYSKPLFVLMFMVAFILAIACANIANLLLARAAARRREIAVRLSLGASRPRVLRQLLTESLLLALPGGVLGLGVAAAGIRFLLWLLGGGSADFQLRATLDWRVLSFTVTVAVATGIIFGLAPAFEALRVELAPALKGTRVSVGRGRGVGLRQILVMAQIALSSLLAIGAIFFVRTLANLHSVEIGFNTENVLTFDLNASKAGYKGAALNAFYNRLEERLRALRGVRGVTATAAPLARRFYRTPVILSRNKTGFAGWNSVGPSFFETMQIPVLLGRPFSSHDVNGAPPVAVVNDVLARTYFPGRNPVGEHVGILDGPIDVTIVGVAANSRESLKEPVSPFVYITYNQFPAPEWRGMSFEIRTPANPLAIAANVQAAIHEAAPDVPVANMMTQAQRIESSLAQERIFADLCTAFAILALTIACIGLYGSMAYAVASRTGEIAIRIALGAQGSGVIWMVMREVLTLTAAGLAIGFVCARTALPAVKSFLFGVKPDDPITIGCVAGLMMVSSLLAGYAPARRASRVNPIKALRHE